MAEHFPRSAAKATRSRVAQRCLNSRDVFRLGGYRPVPREIPSEMAPGLGAGFRGLWRSFFPTRWHSEFWICHRVWFPVAKDMERRDRTVFSVLADELWLMDPSFPGIGSALWLARLENWLALGQEPASRHCVRPVCGCDLRHWVLCS